MTFLGCDTDQLRTLSDTFGEKSARVEELLDQCRTLALAVRWEGPDADVFRDEVQQTVSRGVDVAGTVESQGKDLAGQADDQDATSSSGSASGGAGAEGSAGAASGGGGDTGPLRGEAKAKGDGPLDMLDKVLDAARKKAMGATFDPEDLGKNARRVADALPVLGAIPDGIQMVKAMAAGDTSDAIGNAYEMILGGTPHPAAGVASTANGLAPTEKSPAHHIADQTAHSPMTRAGEWFGGKVSDALGLDHGGTARNLVTSGSGVASHMATAVNPITSPLELGLPAARAVAKAMPDIF